MTSAVYLLLILEHYEEEARAKAYRPMAVYPGSLMSRM